MRIIFILFILIINLCCNNQKTDVPLFSLQQNSGINFVNKVENNKEFNILNYRNFYNGGGCAIGDINNDGRPDIYLTANQGSNKLYLNKGNFKFEDITQTAGVADSIDWSTGVVMVDVNNDGWLDIYVCNAGYIDGKAPQSKLYINQHNLTFTEEAEKYGLDNKGGYATHAAFFDYDGDGDLDCFIINNSFIPVNTLDYQNTRNLRAKDWPVKDFLKGGGDRLLRNDNGKYVDVSQQTGIHGSLLSFGLGVTVGDINNDGWPDVYVSNDFFERDYVYINQKNGTFIDQYEQYIEHSSHSSMGADMVDINNDGYPDIFTTEMLPYDDNRLKSTSRFENYDVNRKKIRSGFGYQYMQNTLQLNNGNNHFCEIAHMSGVAASDWSWGGLIFDANNDTKPDIFVSNGIYKDVTDQDFMEFFDDDNQKMALTGSKEQVTRLIDKMPSVPLPNKMFVNKGGLQFSDSSKAWGLATPSFSNGAAYGDLDGDGDLDLVVNNVNMPAFIYKNNSREFFPTATHYATFQLTYNTNNWFAIGSKIKLFFNHQVITRELVPTRGFQSSVDYKILFGLGNSTIIDSAIIIWPNQNFTTLKNLPCDTLFKISWQKNLPNYNYKKSNAILPLFDTVPLLNILPHVENSYVDFYKERLVPEMLSKEGPHAAVADVNGDGLDDIFICGTPNHPAQIYFQQNNQFIKSTQPALDEDINFEGVCAVFVDLNNDGFKDLIVGGGGNEKPESDKAYHTHIFFNDGKGNFKKGNDLPTTNNNSCICPFDFDNDGDMDIFISSRSTPQDYGQVPKNYLFINDGKGNFKEMDNLQFPDLLNIGMVTGAKWGHLFLKNQTDLVTISEWGTIKIFSFNGKQFFQQKTNLTNFKGLWQSLNIADLNNDGLDDLIMGNIGENFYLQANFENPIKLWINDFDNNGTKDKIITYTINHKDKPIFTRADMSDAMPIIKKTALLHHQYAEMGMNDLFSNEQLKNSQIFNANYLSSCIAMNNGNGNFSIINLPWQAQVSCINATLPTDINHDGFIDLIIGGNKFDFIPQLGRLDALYGSALINDGHGNFTAIDATHSGLNITGSIKDIQPINFQHQPMYIWLRNNEYPVLLKKNKK